MVFWQIVVQWFHCSGLCGYNSSAFVAVFMLFMVNRMLIHVLAWVLLTLTLMFFSEIRMQVQENCCPIIRETSELAKLIV